MLEAQPAEMTEHVRAIERQRIWVPLSPIRYRFRNTLLRNAAYEIQARARLQRLHLKAAQAIEALHADDIEGHLAELARHYRRANAREHARHYLLRAARKATSRYAHTQAKQLYRAYLKLAEDAPVLESILVRYELARDVFEPSGALARAWEEHGRVIADAQRLGSQASEALGWLGRGRVRWLAGQLEEAVACLKQGLAFAREAGHRAGERQLLAQLALVYRSMGRPQDALMIFDQTLRLARDLNEHNEATAFGEIVRRYLADGRAEAALALFEQSMAAAPKRA
jgi:tetratricopeptide (TPR) repeat protein